MLSSDIIVSRVSIVLLGLFVARLLQGAVTGIFNLLYHPLASFPGPRAAALTAWYKTYQEVFLARSWIDVLEELHGTYGKRCNGFRSRARRLIAIRQGRSRWPKRGTQPSIPRDAMRLDWPYSRVNNQNQKIEPLMKQLPC